MTWSQASIAGEMRSIKREAGPGIGSGGATLLGSKGSRSRAGWPGRDPAGVEGPVRRASAGRGNGRTGSRSSSGPDRRPGGPRSGVRRHRSRPSTRGRRHPPPGRGRVLPGPAGWPGRTTAITTNVPTSRATEPSPRDHPEFTRQPMMGRVFHGCQVVSRTLERISTLDAAVSRSAPASKKSRESTRKKRPGAPSHAPGRSARRHANVATSLL
jgi:hypothetical protein